MDQGTDYKIINWKILVTLLVTSSIILTGCISNKQLISGPDSFNVDGRLKIARADTVDALREPSKEFYDYSLLNTGEVELFDISFKSNSIEVSPPGIKRIQNTNGFQLVMPGVRFSVHATHDSLSPWEYRRYLERPGVLAAQYLYSPGNSDTVYVEDTYRLSGSKLDKQLARRLELNDKKSGKRYILDVGEKGIVKGNSRLGVRLSYGRSNLTGSDSGLDPGEIKAFNGGIFYNYQLDRNVSIQPELLFSTRGGLESRSFYVLDEDRRNFMYQVESLITWRQLYLELPVMLQWGRPVGPNSGLWGARNRFGMFFEVGSAIGFRLSQSTDDDIRIRKIGLPVEDYEHDYTEFSKTELSFLIGFGGNLQLGKGCLTSQMRFSAGYANIFQESASINHINLELMLGYAIFLNGEKIEHYNGGK